MKNVLVVMLLVPIMVLASSNLKPVTVLDAGDRAVSLPVETGGGATEPSTMTVLVGTIDTIGGTTYDWQTNGPAYQNVLHSPGQGLHTLFMFSADQAGSFPDRNMRYNFFDYSSNSWTWKDPDFMQSGVSVYTSRVGFGNLGADVTTGAAYTSAHGGSPIKVIAARDMAPGVGIFEYTNGPDGYLWGCIQAGRPGKLHVAMADDATREKVFYSRVNPWATWSTPQDMAPPKPDPTFPDYNIAASKVSEKVCVTWVDVNSTPSPGFYRISTDGGVTWGDPTELPGPNAFGGDTAASFYITSLFPYYDANDKLHIVADVTPVVGGEQYITPAQIWHWCPDNTPNWSRIATAKFADLPAPVGSNALLACRPSMGQDSLGNLYVAWEQFDSANVEPGPPDRLRADIFVAGSSTNGRTWGAPVKITNAGNTSCRYPSIVDQAYAGKLAVIYMIDQKAGSFVQGEGTVSNNPVVCHWLPTNAIPGVAESPQARMPVRTEVTARPNPFERGTLISYALPIAGNVSVTVYDAAGRPIRMLENGYRQAGRYAVAWDGRADNGTLVPAGIYFYTLSTDQTSLSEKLVVVR